MARFKSGCRPEVLREFVESSGLKFHSGPRSWIFECPKCGRKDKLYVRKSDGHYICWYCAETIGYKGCNPEYALADLLNVTVASVKEKLYGVVQHASGMPWIDVDLQDFWSDDEVPSEDLDMLKMEDRCWPPDYFALTETWSAPGQEYLRGRGITDDLQKHYNLKYDPKHERVIFPVEYHGKLYGWQARFIGPTEGINPETGVEWKIPKILTSSPFEREKIVMFADQLDGADQAIVAEGPVDAIKCHDCHEPGKPTGNVVTMGKAVSYRQVAFIRNAGIHKIYLALDPDAAQEIPKLAEKFDDCELYLMKPAPGFKDLGEMTLAGARQQWLAAERIRPGMVFVYLDPAGIPRWR